MMMTSTASPFDMTPDQKARIIAAYEAEERREGGLAYADVRACATRAAASAGVSYAQAREALSEHWAGNVRAG